MSGINATTLPEVHDPMTEALSFMVSALDLLDSANAPGEIGAHLDLAIHCLRKALPPPWTLSAGLARKDCSPA